MTRTAPSLPIITFCGLKSRWTTPAACAAARPRPAATNTSRICCQLRGSARSHWSIVSPVDELHRDEHAVAERARVVDGDDVRVREASDGARLAQQPRPAFARAAPSPCTTFRAMRRSRSGW